MSDNDPTSVPDPALAIAELEVQVALDQAITQLTETGHRVCVAALVVRGVLPDDESFTAAKATGGPPEECARLLLWSAAAVLPHD